MKLSNLKVGMRLALGFGAVIAIMLVVAGFGTYSNNRQMATVVHTLDEDVGYTVSILRLRTQIVSMRRFEKDMALNAGSPAEAKKYLEQWRGVRERAQMHIKNALAHSPGEEQSEFLASTDRCRAAGRTFARRPVHRGG